MYELETNETLIQGGERAVREEPVSFLGCLLHPPSSIPLKGFSYMLVVSFQPAIRPRK
jgi:hypothetical protein